MTHNSVEGNSGKQINSGGIVVASAKALTKGSDPNFDTVAFNSAFRDHPADLIWDGTGVHVTFRANHCGTAIPPGLWPLTLRFMPAPGAIAWHRAPAEGGAHRLPAVAPG